MKVFFPIGSFYPAQSGGPSNTIYWLAKALKKEGIDVVVSTTDMDIPKGKVILNEWIESEAGTVRYNQETNYSLCINHIKNSLKPLKTCDIIHLTSLFHFPSIILGGLAWILNKKIIWSVRGELAAEALIYNSAKKRIVLFLLKCLQGKITFHSTSSTETSYIKKVFKEDISIIELPNFMWLPNKTERTNKEKYLLYVGRIHPIKALDKIIEGLAKSVLFLEQNIVFKIVGKYENTLYVENLKEKINNLGIENKIVWLGEIVGVEKERIFAGAYFTLLLSETENFGNVVVESLAQGTPVIASFGTPWEVLEEKNAGFWIDNNIKSIALTIDTILNLSEQKYNELRNNSYLLADNQFNIKKNIDRWIINYTLTFND